MFWTSKTTPKPYWMVKVISFSVLFIEKQAKLPHFHANEMMCENVVILLSFEWKVLKKKLLLPFSRAWEWLSMFKTHSGDFFYPSCTLINQKVMSFLSKWDHKYVIRHWMCHNPTQSTLKLMRHSKIHVLSHFLRALMIDSFNFKWQ